MTNEPEQADSQHIAEIIEIPVGSNAATLQIGKRVFIVRRTSPNLLQVIPGWLSHSNKVASKNGELFRAS